MSTVHLKRTDETVRQIIAATFSEFTGTHITARIQETVVLHGTMWDDGCKRDYMLLDLRTMTVLPIPEAPYMQDSPMHENQIKMEPGLVVVCLNHFRGKQSLEIISSAVNVTPLLPAPIDLTDDERTVLIATRSLKSSYAGVKDYRFQEARRHRGITRERWDAAVASLKSRKYLNAAGAITTDGRNAVGGECL